MSSNTTPPNPGYIIRTHRGGSLGAAVGLASFICHNSLTAIPRTQNQGQAMHLWS